MTERVAKVWAMGLGVTTGGQAAEESTALHGVVWSVVLRADSATCFVNSYSSSLILPQDIHQLKAGFPALF